jgi:hypothetical protein
MQYFTVISDAKDVDEWSSREAYFRGYFEIFDMGYTIWGSYSRLQGFFRDNGDLLKQHFGGPASTLDPKTLLQAHFTQQFKREGGFDCITSIVEKLINQEPLVPFLFLHSFTNLLAAVFVCEEDGQKETLIEKLIKSTHESI